MRRLAACLVLCAAAASFPGLAWAKTSRELPYGYDPVWSALVRFLRVDEKLKVVEKDADTGYVLFELSEGKRTFSGAAELLRTEGGRGTRLTLRIEDRPSYMELGLIDRFEVKLRDELGQPPPPPAPAPPPPPPAPEEKKE
jgi:hypothetical protein